MAPRTLPGLGLSGFWDFGENGWNDANDINLRLLSALVQASVLSATTALPGSPTNGDIYIVPSGGDAGKIAIRDDGAWVLVTPKEGFLAWVKDTDKYVRYDGTAWDDLTAGGGGGLEDAPSDGKLYGRKDAAWSEVAVSAPAGRNHTGTADTFVLADANNVVASNNAASVAQTIPTNAAVAFPIFTTLTVIQKGAGTVTLTAASGVTLRLPPGALASSGGQWATISVIQVAADEWVATGQLGAAP